MELYKIAASNLNGIGINKLKKICNKTNGLKGVFEKSTKEISELLGIKKDIVLKMQIKEALMINLEKRV